MPSTGSQRVGSATYLSEIFQGPSFFLSRRAMQHLRRMEQENAWLGSDTNVSIEFIRYPEDYTKMGCVGANLCFLVSERPTRSACLLETCFVRC